MDVILEGDPDAGSHDGPYAIPLEPEDEGYFSGTDECAHRRHSMLSRLDEGEALPILLPVAATWGGPREVVDPTGFPWTDQGWSGVTIKGQVLYELHVGTFMEGTWKAP